MNRFICVEREKQIVSKAIEPQMMTIIHALECRWVNNAALPDICYLLVSPPVRVLSDEKLPNTKIKDIGTLYKYTHLPFIINT